jgi:hypothetical protein
MIIDMAKKDSIAMLEAKIEVLTRARESIQAGMEPFICYAINRVVAKNKREDKSVDELLEYIEKSLGDNAFLSGWVRANRPKLHSKTYETNFMRKARLQWMDWMLSCLEEDLHYKRAKEKKKTA